MGAPFTLGMARAVAALQGWKRGRGWGLVCVCPEVEGFLGGGGQLSLGAGGGAGVMKRRKGKGNEVTWMAMEMEGSARRNGKKNKEEKQGDKLNSIKEWRQIETKAK